MRVPRLSQSLWVFHRDVDLEIVEVFSLEALNHVQLIAMRMADAIEPGFFVEANRVDDKSIPIPMTDRIAHIRQTDVIAIRMLARIDKNVAYSVVILIKDKDLFRSLYDLQRKRLQIDSR